MYFTFSELIILNIRRLRTQEPRQIILFGCNKEDQCALHVILRIAHCAQHLFTLFLLKTSVPGTGFWQRVGEPGFSSANVRHGSVTMAQNSCPDCFSKTKKCSTRVCHYRTKPRRANSCHSKHHSKSRRREKPPARNVIYGFLSGDSWRRVSSHLTTFLHVMKKH